MEYKNDEPKIPINKINIKQHRHNSSKYNFIILFFQYLKINNSVVENHITINILLVQTPFKVYLKNNNSAMKKYNENMLKIKYVNINDLKCFKML